MKVKFESHIAWQIEPSKKIVYVTNLLNQEFYAFESIGALVWMLIESKFEIEDIVEVIAEKYLLPKVQVEQDIQEFIDKLLQNGLTKYEE